MDFPGKTKTQFFKNEEFLSQPFVKLSPPKALARYVAENVFRVLLLSIDRERFATTINHHHQRRRKDFEFK
jgi:hypothetical protein